MPNKYSKNCIINAELTDCQWDKNLIGQKFSAFVEMIIEKKSNQALAKQSRNNKTSNKAPKQPAWFATFAQEFQQFKQEFQQFKQEFQQFKQEMYQFKQETNQKILATNQLLANFMQEMREFKQEINQRIDNLISKNKLNE